MRCTRIDFKGDMGVFVELTRSQRALHVRAEILAPSSTRREYARVDDYAGQTELAAKVYMALDGGPPRPENLEACYRAIRSIAGRERSDADSTGLESAASGQVFPAPVGAAPLALPLATRVLNTTDGEPGLVLKVSGTDDRTGACTEYSVVTQYGIERWKTSDVLVLGHEKK